MTSWSKIQLLQQQTCFLVESRLATGKRINERKTFTEHKLTLVSFCSGFLHHQVHLVEEPELQVLLVEEHELHHQVLLVEQPELHHQVLLVEEPDLQVLLVEQPELHQVLLLHHDDCFLPSSGLINLR
uniref:Uncharacterized protein n=1 Tax=Amphiprion ocellaris TaxID=80972 RepID=A0AAQ5Z2D6_AMPOC